MNIANTMGKTTTFPLHKFKILPQQQQPNNRGQQKLKNTFPL